MSAHSYRDGRRWWNHDRFATYCAAVEHGGGAAAVAGERRLSPRERATEALFSGLRHRDGIGLSAFRERYGLDPLVDWREGTDSAVDAGLVLVDADRLRLTGRGMLLSNEVFRLRPTLFGPAPAGVPPDKGTSVRTHWAHVRAD